MTVYDDVIKDALKQKRKRQEGKVALLSDTTKMDKYVAGIAQQLSPTTKMASKKKADLLVDRVDRSIDDDSSMKGFGPEFRSRFSEELAKPGNVRYSANTIAKGITKGMLEQTDDSGKTRLEKAYETFRVEDSARGLFFIGGKSKKIKAPAAMTGMKTYREWKEDRRAEEDVKLKGKYTLEGHIESAYTAAGVGGGIGATAALVAGQLGPQVATPEELVTVPTAAAIGAITAGSVEMIAYPYRKWVESTEWGRARTGKGGFIGKAKVLATQYGPDLIAAGGAEVKLLSSVVRRSTAMANVVAQPSAKNISLAKKADDQIKATAKTTAKKPLNMRKYDGVKTIKKFVKDNKLDIPDDDAVKLGKEYGELSSDGQIKAYTHKGGLLEGIPKELEKEKALAFARGETTADDVVKAVSKPKVKGKPTAKTKPKVESKKETLVKTEAVAQKAEDKLIEYKPEYSQKDTALSPVQQQQEKQMVTTKASREVLTLVGRNSEPEKVITKAHAAVDEVVPSNIQAVKAEEQLIQTKQDFPSTFDESDHAYLPVSNKKLDSILEEGVKEGTFSPSTEAALKTRKGKNIIRVKKDALSIESKGKKTAISKTELKPEDIEIKQGDQWLSPEDYKTTKDMGLQYEELGDYYDKLLVKYHPDLDPASHKKAMAQKVLQANKNLPTKLAPDELNKLNKMLTKYDDIERTVLKLKEEIPDISLKDMRSSMVSIMKTEKAGELAVDEVIKQVDDLSLRVAQSPTLLGSDKNETLGAMSEYTAMLRKKAGIIKFFATFGVSAALFESLTADEAEAFNWGGIIGKGVSKEALAGFTKKTISALERKSLAVGRITKDDAFHITEEGFQTGLKESANGGAKYFIENLNTLYRGAGKRLAFGTMSPQMQFNEVLKATPGKLINPGVFKATFFNAEAVNVKNGLRVAANIFKDGNVIAAKKEISKLFKPLLPQAESQYKYDYHKQMIDEIGTRLNRMKNPHKDVVKEMRRDMHIHEGTAKKLEPEVAAYHAAFQEFGQEAAEKYSTSRVFFAADDSVKFKKYPFMKNIPLTEQEALAAGRLKRQMATYRLRLEKNKVKTISGDYMHYSMHPNMKADVLTNEAGYTAAPWMKNFTRSINARPLMPDAVESMGRYILDTERRIQTQAYWNSGWGEAMRRSAHIQPLQQAFRQLKEGVVPFENTWINTVARWYSNVEVFKRLFLSPSAGLKHLLKLTGDMATLGVRTTVHSMPSAVKGVSHRIIENTPFMKKIAGKLHNPSHYDKMKKQLLDSVAPAMDSRYRMMQMGFGNYDTYFSKAGVLANEVNHVGGVFINTAELIDRSTTMEAGLRIAAKQGLTPDQAMYGIYDTILKNNFLGREFTPRWLREPVFKLLTMFQVTPYKMAEKRLVNAVRSKRAVTALGKDIFHASKTAEGRQKLLTDLRTIRKDMFTAQQELKANLFLDALRSEQDFYGNAVVKQFVKDLLILGAGTAVAGSVGMNLAHHFFHLPFLKSSQYDDFGTLNVSPVIGAINAGHHSYIKKLENDEDAMWTTEIIQKWMGKSGPFPDTMWKYNRISQDDIPEIYGDSKFKYLFAIPSKENH